MAKLKFRSVSDFEQYEGKELGVSDYFYVSQLNIDLFSFATFDNQWIHTDLVRAKTEKPFHSTIAHGYPTLALFPYLFNQIVEVEGVRMAINYEINNLCFKAAVLSGQSVRLRATLKDIRDLRNVAKVTISVTMEIKETSECALQGDVVFLYSFN